ncbi:3-deoxy-D-manno-octulosonic acid transferase [Albibacterium bauzanense]|uniref:3-deoxy-D-manno-octulosonic acid transferase n=1 Tax=Albibacterium bauzanense TaxID=653929 RepID=A0A4R1M1E1_9SPHI|nr:glycosyltransferase N-terminal domain-containing protein [Albibacterium bauzanense]TCK83379.1 3-deoxy-D-manno-octulosonic-acid transferase [Albibacterium bauzanense]
MTFIYSIGIYLFHLLIWIAAVFGGKAKKWAEGRKGLFEKIREEVDSTKKHTWFHFASLGEFEQGRSVLEKYKKLFPDRLILITFFSPSGYETRKNFSLADHVFYLPADSAFNAKRFIDLINPEIVFFTKYDFWYFYFRELKQREIPLFMVSSIFRADQVFFKWYGGIFRKMLSCVTHFFVQNQESVVLLRSIGFNNVTLSGDTRFDRVVEIAKTVRELPVISYFATGNRVLVAGSTWPQDLERLLTFHQVFPDWKIIIAPHDITPQNIKYACDVFSSGILFSDLSDYMHKRHLESENQKKRNIDMDLAYQDTDTEADLIPEHKSPVLIVDNIGMLSSLYGYGDIAYIGGGFGAGIHNTLEAAAYGMPVIFGPNFQKFQEAKDLIQARAAFFITNGRELISVVEELMDYQVRIEAGNRAVGYVQQQAGATDRILDYIEEHIL